MRNTMRVYEYMGEDYMYYLEQEEVGYLPNEPHLFPTGTILVLETGTYEVVKHVFIRTSLMVNFLLVKQ